MTAAFDVDPRGLECYQIGPGEDDCRRRIVKRHGRTRPRQGDIDEAAKKVGKKFCVDALRPPQSLHILWRGEDPAAEIQIDHGQRQTLGEHDGGGLRVCKGVELRRAV